MGPGGSLNSQDLFAIFIFLHTKINFCLPFTVRMWFAQIFTPESWMTWGKNCRKTFWKSIWNFCGKFNFSETKKKNKSCEFSDPPGPHIACICFGYVACFCFTVGRIPHVNIMTTYSARGPGGSTNLANLVTHAPGAMYHSSMFCFNVSQTKLQMVCENNDHYSPGPSGSRKRPSKEQIWIFKTVIHIFVGSPSRNVDLILYAVLVASFNVVPISTFIYFFYVVCCQVMIGPWIQPNNSSFYAESGLYI